MGSGSIKIGEKIFIPLNVAMQALLYDRSGIEKCIRQGMPKIMYQGEYYFCLLDCHKWHSGKW